MSTRHIARTLALQTLFELDMKDELATAQDAIDPIISRNRDEFGEDIRDTSFTKDILVNVLSRRITIDDIITRAAPDWPLDKIGTVDRNILRIGLAELLFGDRAQVPPKVAIDEAIELAKAYGGETSGRFVNGVLGAIYKEMGEPEKDQTTRSKAEALKSAPREILAGAVVLSKEGGRLYVGLVHDVFGYWTLPKGRIDIEEGEVAGAKRKIEAEIGIPVEIKEKLGENEYIANKPETGKVIKHVSYYVAEANHVQLNLEKKTGLDDAKWFPVGELEELRMYDDIKPLIAKALELTNTMSNAQ